MGNVTRASGEVGDEGGRNILRARRPQSRAHVQAVGGADMFADLFGFDPSSLVISNLVGNLIPDHLTFGVRFDTSGDVIVANVGFSQSEAVPTPAVLPILASGLIAA